MSASYTVGDGMTYTVDIQDAIDDIPGDLSAEGKQWVQVYAKAGGYAETLDVNTGFSNASDNVDFVDVEAMESHGGIRGNGIVIDTVSAATDVAIYLKGTVRFHGFCVTRTTWKAAVANYEIYTGPVNTSPCYIYDNIIYDLTSDVGTINTGIFAAAGKAFVANNQIFNCTRTICSYVFVNGAAGNQHKYINNSFVNNTGTGAYGIQANNCTYVLVHNNYIGNCGIDYNTIGGANSSTTYNISSDATADDWGGVGNLINKAASDQFVSVTAGSEDLHLKATADCFRNGADMSAYFTHDCVNIPRKFWRTGAFETLPTVYSVNDGNPHKVYYSWGGNLAKVDGVDVPLRNTESMIDNDTAAIQVGQFSGGIQSGGLIGDLRIYADSDVKDTRP